MAPSFLLPGQYIREKMTDFTESFANRWQTAGDFALLPVEFSHYARCYYCKYNFNKLDRKQSLLQKTALIRLCDKPALKMNILQRKGSKGQLLQHC